VVEKQQYIRVFSDYFGFPSVHNLNNTPYSFSHSLIHSSPTLYTLSYIKRLQSNALSLGFFHFH
jgi:hypothetical protein